MLVRAQDLPAAPEDQYRLALSLYGRGEYAEALQAFTRAQASLDAALTLRARKGAVRAALRIAEFDVARREAETLARDAGMDAEVLALFGDALWSAGQFDEADGEYARALALEPESSRARFGIARSLGARSRLVEALAEARAALRSGPRDPDLHALTGTLSERLNRFDEAADAFVAYADLLPAGEATAMSIARGRAGFLRSFEGREPLSMSRDDAGATHTVPFKLVRNKVVVQGRLNGLAVEWVLDTGAERTGVSQALATSARIRPAGATLTAGVGRAALRRVQLGRADLLEIGSLRVHNVPVSIRQPARGGAPRWQGQSLSPLALGLSVVVDYGRRRVTLARGLSDTASDFTLPMRVHHLPFVRGTLNTTHAVYFVVDTGGEVISISAETAQALRMEPIRRIPLRVMGLSGQDEGAFLLPGVDLDFEEIEYRKIGLAVLNLRAPSVLLGFQVGGIVGHRFLSPFRVSLDLERSELRLEKF
jgi:predicted aspartyl protease/Flp pilus assembly protein TadD